MEGRFFLNVVVAEGTTILELFTGKNETLLVRGDAVRTRFGIVGRYEIGRLPLLVLNFGLDIVDGVGRLHLEGDRLPREGLDEDLHLFGVGVRRDVEQERLTSETRRSWE